MARIIVKNYLPLDSKEAIDKLLQFAREFNAVLNDEAIGEVLQHINKVKLQLYFRTKIDEINSVNLASNKRDRQIRAMKAELGYTEPTKPKKKKKPQPVQEYAEGAESYDEALEIEQQLSEQEQPYYSHSNDVWNSDLDGSHVINIPMGGMNKRR